MASEKAKEIVSLLDEWGCPPELRDLTIGLVDQALEQHGAACARLAAEYMADSMITPGRDGRVDAAVQHAKEAQDE